MQSPPDIRRRMLAIIIAAAAALTTFAATAHAETSPTSSCDMTVTRVDSSRYPFVRIAFVKECDSSSIPEFSVSENDKKVSNVNVYNGRIGLYESNPKTEIMLLLDSSMTMKSPKIDYAKNAATALLDQAKNGDKVGLATFGGEAKLIESPTEDTSDVATAARDVELQVGTEFYDGIGTAINAFSSKATRRIVVVLADGQDTQSKLSIDQVIDKAKANDVEIFTVGIEGKVFYPKTLKKLSGSTGGEFQSVANARELEGLFDTLGQQLLRGYWMEYRSSQPSNTDVKLLLESDGDVVIPYSYHTPRVKGTTDAIKPSVPKTSKGDKPLVALPRGPVGMIIASIPFALIIIWLVQSKLNAIGRPNLEQRIDPYTKRAEDLRVENRKQGKRPAEALAPAMHLAERLLGGSALFEHFHFVLEQANIPLRSVELLFLNIFFGGIFGMFSFLILGLKLGAIGLLIGSLLPYLWVRLKARKRKKLFEDQLADVLSTVSSSLKAGHSFNQAIASIIKETPDPTASEFQRAMTEARLGIPLEEALEDMAKRLGSNDFDFVVTTVNIQRTVGGSLAEILEMVGDTVRGRQQFRKKVKALVSMGTASAYVLLAMPFFMAGVLTLMKPDYMRPLFFTPTGHKMMMAGAVFMTIGYFACMKVVKVKV